MATCKFTFLFLVLLVAACGGGKAPDAEDNHGYGHHFDVLGASGMKLRFTPTFAAVNPLANISRYETAFQEVQACMGVTAPPPFLVIVPEGALGSAPDPRSEGHPLRMIGGRYFSKPPLIVIDENASQYRHEAVHYLREVATGDPDENHTSDLFARCAGG